MRWALGRSRLKSERGLPFGRPCLAPNSICFGPLLLCNLRTSAKPVSRGNDHVRTELSGGRLRKKLPMRLGASRVRLPCASRINAKGHSSCTICRRCRNYAARDLAGRPARHSRWRRNSMMARARRSSPIRAPRCVPAQRAAELRRGDQEVSQSRRPGRCLRQETGHWGNSARHGISARSPDSPHCRILHFWFEAERRAGDLGKYWNERCAT